MNKLKTFGNSAEIFHDQNELTNFMDKSNEQKILLIINETDAEQILHLIHDFAHVDSVFILSCDQVRVKEHLFRYKKVKGIFNDMAGIQRRMKILRYENHDSFSFETANSSSNFFPQENTKKNKQELMFMYAQILKEILTELPCSPLDMDYMIEFCLARYINEPSSVEQIVEFERDYKRHSPVWWYTKDTFLYRMLNIALRTHDFPILYAMRVFVQDLHKELVQLHIDSEQTPFLTLYRGQPMQHEDFDRIRTNIGGLFSVNQFWSTSKDREFALEVYAGYTNNDANITAVLFEINVKSTNRSTVSFANISNLSNFGVAEMEYLFTMGSVFRIESVERSDSINVWHVKLSLTSDRDPQLKLLAESIKSSVYPGKPYHIGSLAILLMYLDENQLAAEIIETCVKRESNRFECLKFRWTLGLIYARLEKTQQALINYDYVVRSYFLRYLSIDVLSMIFHGLGELCILLRKFELAIVNFKIALHVEMLRQPHHDEKCLLQYCRDIGIAYEGNNRLNDALTLYQIAHEKALKCYPDQHPWISRCELDMIRVTSKMGQDDRAESLINHYIPNIKNSLPKNHKMQTKTQVLAGYRDLERGDFASAHAQFQNALAIDRSHKRESEPSNYAIYWAIATAFGREGRFYDAMDALNTALSIQMTVFPAGHPDIAMTYREIGKTYEMLEELSEAFQYYQQALDIFLVYLSTSEPDVIETQQHISRICHKIEHHYQLRKSNNSK